MQSTPMVSSWKVSSESHPVQMSIVNPPRNEYLSLSEDGLFLIINWTSPKLDIDANRIWCLQYNANSAWQQNVLNPFACFLLLVGDGWKYRSQFLLSQDNPHLKAAVFIFVSPGDGSVCILKPISVMNKWWQDHTMARPPTCPACWPLQLSDPQLSF